MTDDDDESSKIRARATRSLPSKVAIHSSMADPWGLRPHGAQTPVPEPAKFIRDLSFIIACNMHRIARKSQSDPGREAT